MRVRRSPVSWGCLESSAVKRREGGEQESVPGKASWSPAWARWLPWGSAQGSRVTRVKRGSACDLQGRLACAGKECGLGMGF